MGMCNGSAIAVQRSTTAGVACRGTRGFTLIELMIALAVISILAAVGYPSYKDYVLRSRIAEATGELSTARVRLEQYYQDARPSNYGSTASACGIAAPSSGSFTYSCAWGADSTSQTFLLTATGKASAGMSGFTFTIDSANAQRTTAYPGASGLPAACWLTRRSDTC